ncbi:beta-1-3-glucan-binding protein-like 2 [Homarus americanus]|uniref:Beta-1-3-glucan-binding protein-like 2 n=1 Tax=Homarus americanus TaxID=6706 RepID=A0A8J5K776_HOMAM|nr:beta-1-3-glucan-binding protein-like 2 [Homarus americanus]
MILLFLLYLACGVFAADVVDPKDCTAFPCMIFSDDFDYLDHDAWEHEITMSGGGNWEFEVYVNNRSVSYTRNSTLFIKPGLTSEWKSEEFLTSGDLNLWGMNGRGDVCTGNSYYGCNRVGTATNIVNPVTSARLRTLSDFAFSGEIDIVESRGNSDYGTLGNQYGSTTLHWGPYWQLNMYQKTHTKYQAPTGSYADNFHTWRMDWTKDDMKFYVDDELKLTVDPFTNFWDFGGFGDSYDNPWAAGGKMAPFDQKFYIVLNLAVGGTNGFFPDDHSSWLPTWEQGEGRISEKAALQVDYVKVWKMENIDQ